MLDEHRYQMQKKHGGRSRTARSTNLVELRIAQEPGIRHAQEKIDEDFPRGAGCLTDHVCPQD